MPQMAPMWWTSLFMFFLMIFMLTLIMISSQPQIKVKKSSKTNLNYMNWKW